MIYLWKCAECDVLVEIERPIKDCTLSPDPGIKCGCVFPSDHAPVWQRVYEAPAILTASLPDGTRRKGWHLEKMASQLEIDAASEKPETAAAIRREARSLRQRNSQGKD